MRVVDFLIICIAVALSAASAFFIYGSSGGADIVTVSAEGGVVWEYPLGAAERLSVPGPLGDTVVEIKDGSARIASSPCPNKTCVARGALSKAGEFSACLPNRVMLTIKAGRQKKSAADRDKIDAATW